MIFIVSDSDDEGKQKGRRETHHFIFKKILWTGI